MHRVKANNHMTRYRITLIIQHWTHSCSALHFQQHLSHYFSAKVLKNNPKKAALWSVPHSLSKAKLSRQSQVQASETSQAAWWPVDEPALEDQCWPSANLQRKNDCIIKKYKKYYLFLSFVFFQVLFKLKYSSSLQINWVKPLLPVGETIFLGFDLMS